MNKADPELLKNVPLSGFSGYGRAQKFTLCDLSKFKDENVGDLINRSIYEYLDKTSFNSTNEITKWMNLFKIDIEHGFHQYKD